MIIALTLGIFSARSQSAYNDTLHITPAMVDSINASRRVEKFDRDVEPATEERIANNVKNMLARLV